MAIGYVFISAAPSKEHEVYEALLKLSSSSESRETITHRLDVLFGEWDLVTVLEAKDYNELGLYVVNGIKKIPGVIDTKLHTGIKF